MEEKYLELARSVPREDRPVSKNKLSGLGNFFGLYGGEHIAATEFVIGATMVTWGVTTREIIVGLLIGNLLATLTYAFLCAPIAVDTRKTLYSYLREVLGPYMQKIYNVVWGLASIAMASSMLNVSASALRVIFGITPQLEWYPTSFKFILLVLLLGVIVTIVAANGFEAVAKFSAICVPWMIAIFFAGAMISLPVLAAQTGYGEINSLKDFLNIADASIWTGSAVGGGERLGTIHVIGFAWMCNLAYHGGLNDMSLLRFAKRSSYGFVTGYGMYIGHFFAWISAGVMGATAANVLGQSLSVLDSGAVMSTIFGLTGLLAVVVAGWTTANPNIYRAALSFGTFFPKTSIKKVSYIVGIVTTLIAMFPIVANIMVIVNVIVLVVPTIGAIVLAEHWILPKLGGTRYWSKYKGWKINYAGLIAWGISLMFVITVSATGLIHSYLLFLPNYLLAMGSYIFLALRMGAREDYAEQVEEDKKLSEAIDIINDEENPVNDSETQTLPGLIKGIKWISYLFLIILIVLSIFTFNGNYSVESMKATSIWLTLLYFIFGGFPTIYKFRLKNKNKLTENLERQIE
ncbi:cytosine permease [Carnobacterium sp. 17-4]|uniref:cytosine permease n=1 Tax=Carnobacterium sp. (strain 17-4) TaxID=208596 RepID=UPI0002059375|nr:cytosine permease [Carnobacterium sp. 17-4]AEB31017.1 cytosine permease [Carnobacterium sp. 17-4]